MKYWKNGFYDEPIDGSVEITEEYYQELLACLLYTSQVKKKTENYNAAKDKVEKKDNQVKKSEKEVRAQISELADTIDCLLYTSCMDGESVRGKGEVYTVKSTNYFNYSELWM